MDAAKRTRERQAAIEPDGADAARILKEQRELLERARNGLIAPAPGVPATYNIGSDFYGGVIDEVFRKGQVVTFRFVDNNGIRSNSVDTFTRRKRPNGHISYVLKGRDYGFLMVGYAETRLDRGF